MKRRYVLFLVCFVITISLFYIFQVMVPSHDRTWEFGLEKLPRIKIKNHTVSISDFRDYRYSKDKTTSIRYIDRTVDLNALERVWFVVEPFDGFKQVKFGGIAHTYFVFDFADSQPVVVSVEARREKGEQFGLLRGLFNQFELMYVWGSEEDLTTRRVLIEKNKLYMYPLTISKDSSKKLFLQLAQTTKDLEKTPRFYNSISSNCTNELAKNANLIKPNTIPMNLTWFFPGFAGKDLYELGFIPNDEPFETVTTQYFISDIVRKHTGKEDFSELLRKSLSQGKPQ